QRLVHSSDLAGRARVDDGFGGALCKPCFSAASGSALPVHPLPVSRGTVMNIQDRRKGNAQISQRIQRGLFPISRKPE
ncbi:MAG: hypothetical protein KJO15_03135, partial [Alphaproteobacteria bacterium]|nr:hypothetical protein [Alphaproteobacteria bacterium]